MWAEVTPYSLSQPRVLPRVERTTVIDVDGEMGFSKGLAADSFYTPEISEFRPRVVPGPPSHAETVHVSAASVNPGLDMSNVAWQGIL